MNVYHYRVRSQPEYFPFAWDDSGTQHLLVLSGADDNARRELGARPCPGPLQLLALAGPGADLAQGLAAAGAVLEVAATAEALQERLSQRLSGSCMGLRIYAIGSEDSIWSSMKTARRFGMGADEVRLYQAGPEGRPVSCVHCGTHMASVHTNVVRCSGCGRHLLVRDHFSRLLGAYMGVQVDAEKPGELPKIEEVYP